MRHRHVYSDTIEDIEIEYAHEPYSDVLSEKVGDKLVVAYLVQDSDCENPMTSYDGEGTLYTKPSRGWGGGSITDDSSWGRYLGLTEDGEPDLKLDAVKERARELMRPTVATDQDFIDYCLEEFEEFSCIEDCFDTIDFDNWSLPSWMYNRLEDFLERAWDQLDDEGVLRERLSVPVNYCSNNHGPGTASAYTASIDNCNAVWVPDQNCINNMTPLPCGLEIEWEGNGGGPKGRQYVLRDKGVYVKGFNNYVDALDYIKANYPQEITRADQMKAAYKHADSVLENYINWCNGDCYGCVVETFDAQGEQIDEDSCWGFIGMEYAEESLKNDFFKPALEHALKEPS
jgi:hypothetical protein